ncbi:hypothetical protein NAT65_25855 [Achromobacter xylosoxidans]|uniref:hypothetical protein n=1 Tax=Alcaligenes xylosoxydans xylosoxydans TaxID=85698 RepID=UPI00203EEE2C|nr:hypothetical protein [Achromobacter xylosoxidans]MCM2574526.1 hypothetical protein [Achromobacter xylosoxidans]WPQ34337.1 hypothetical protein SLH34_27605 [Achromobacter xylosoxidans]
MSLSYVSSSLSASAGKNQALGVDNGEILNSIESLQNSIAKCEFALHELIGRLSPVLAPSPADNGDRLPMPATETQVAQLIQAADERIQSLIQAAYAASKRLALP